MQDRLRELRDRIPVREEERMTLRDLMKRQVTTITPEDALHVAEGIMSLGELRHLPVVSGGALVGILTHRDILQAPVTFFGFATDPRAVLRALTVRDVMTTQVVSIEADATVSEAAQKLLKHKVGCLPVLERGALVGIVTTSDLLGAIVAAEEGEGDATGVPPSPAPVSLTLGGQGG